MFKSSNRNTKILTREWENFECIETDKIETITIIIINWLIREFKGIKEIREIGKFREGISQ